MEKHTVDSKSGSILIKQVKIADPGSVLNNRTTDIFIFKGVITKIGNALTEKADIIIDGKNCIATPGLFDLRCRQGEPGLEQNETIESLMEASAAGGITGLATLPDGLPCVQSRSQIEFIRRKAYKKPVNIYPLGATTINTIGEELAELYDMHQGGASGFSNGDQPYNSGTLQRALLYSKIFNTIVFSHAEDKNLSHGGSVNESNNTASLGLKYFSAHAEYTEIEKQIAIAEYCDSSLHFSHISSKHSVEIIKKAKSKGLKISCDVSILHLIYTDESMADFDVNLKLMPPLRCEIDRKALVKAVIDGTIDCIVSDHNPHSPETKFMEFNYSPYGAITIQIMFSLYNQFLTHQIPLENFIKSTSINPRRILNLPIPTINTEEKANLAIFNTELQWMFNLQNNKSLSCNSHLLNTTLKGKCIMVVNDTLHQSF